MAFPLIGVALIILAVCLSGRKPRTAHGKKVRAARRRKGYEAVQRSHALRDSIERAERERNAR